MGTFQQRSHAEICYYQATCHQCDKMSTNCIQSTKPLIRAMLDCAPSYKFTHVRTYVGMYVLSSPLRSIFYCLSSKICVLTEMPQALELIRPHHKNSDCPSPIPAAYLAGHRRCSPVLTVVGVDAPQRRRSVTWLFYNNNSDKNDNKIT